MNELDAYMDSLQEPQRYADGGPIKPPKKNKPIIVSDPKDPRLIAYQDSLQRYNYYKNAYESSPEPKKRGLKYEGLLKGSKYGDKFYMESGEFANKPIILVKKPTPPTKQPVPHYFYEKPVPIKQPSLEPLQLQDKQLQPTDVPPAITYPKAINNYSAAGYPMVGGKTVPEGRVYEKGWKERYSTGGYVDLDSYMEELTKSKKDK